MKTPSIKSINAAFSLVELLVVIAVIAIIAAIAIPNIANITTQARYAKDQRNAQNLASVASAAKAAGVTNNLSTIALATNLLVGTTVSVTNGGQVLTFGISPLSATDRTGMTNHLQNNGNANGAVLYTPSTNAY
jgi:type IV pilus assembly protein PilA